METVIFSSEINNLFMPDIPEQYREDYNKFKIKLKNAFPGYRKMIVLEEVKKYSDTGTLSELKYKTILSVLYDLLSQGYTLSFNENNDIELKISIEDAEDKSFIKANLLFERNSQFDLPNIKDFISYMEREKIYKSKKISIFNLIGDGKKLLLKIKNNSEKIVEPYIQLATNKIDEHTGYLLKDIWRYFRYTWSIPYKNTPGRNMFYLVRDASEEYHPVIGIFALGNCVLNLTVRDELIGWSYESIKNQMKRKSEINNYTCKINNSSNICNIKNIKYLESIDDYKIRTEEYSKKTINLINKFIDCSLDEIYKKDLEEEIDFSSLTFDDVDNLKARVEKLKGKLLNTPHLDEKNNNFERDAQLPLYCKKRYQELSKLIEAKLIIKKYQNKDYFKWLDSLIKNSDGQKAIRTAIIANRKVKIGSNMMEIIVCGSIPPYNEILGGKLVSILSCSPQVIYDYSEKYKSYTSIIASRMSGKKIVRDSSLVFLGTTSLYSKCSSQYNRISVIDEKGEELIKFKKTGVTEGFGSLYYSKQTTDLLKKLMVTIDGGKRINNVFGEGTSPKFRLLSTGLAQLGLKSNFLKHNSPRIVYSIPLAKNTYEYLMGYDEQPIYNYEFSKKNVKDITNYYIDYWKKRWLLMRISNKDVQYRLSVFEKRNIIVSNNK